MLFNKFFWCFALLSAALLELARKPPHTKPHHIKNDEAVEHLTVVYTWCRALDSRVYLALGSRVYLSNQTT
ncbi:unnamed protein product [Callosobruchus maculatus]|uniref:Secreted protein n=1 Tax=Callosobruchus maculatus TaxID=64391 RepID=A0A653BGM0_CALMS|nr:unnamed protein product [Callosobruchus maculatus]VEN34682.1 unnamed protein product [Callosobruchus maculatus]